MFNAAVKLWLCKGEELHLKEKPVAQHHLKCSFNSFTIVNWEMGAGRKREIDGKGQFYLMPT